MSQLRQHNLTFHLSHLVMSCDTHSQSYKSFPSKNSKTIQDPRWPPPYDTILRKLGVIFQFHKEPWVILDVCLMDSESLTLTTFMVYSFENLYRNSDVFRF